MNDLTTSALIVLTVPVWWAWLRALARLACWSLLPPVLVVVSIFAMLAAGSFMDGLFGWERGSGAAGLFLLVPVFLLGWILIAVVRSAWRWS